MTTYRFWGTTDPRGRQKLPILASQPVVDEDPWTLQLYEPVDSWGGDWGTSAAEFAAALRPIPDAADMVLRINSPGGEVYEAIAIANMLRGRAGSLHVRVDGLAASAASYLAVLGDRVTMGADTEFMIHDPWGVAIGAAADMTAMAARLDALGDTLAAAYARKAGGDVAEWRDVMRAERWYTAAEAVAAGLADDQLGDVVEELPAAAMLQAQCWTPRLHRPARPPATTDPPTDPPPDPPADQTPAGDPPPGPLLADLRAGIIRALEEATR